jgi:hypothetical protein
MLSELRALLAASHQGASREDYELAILENNVLSKRSSATRGRSARYLRELYVLDPSTALFRGLVRLWTADVTAQPLLALICALARDPLLRATASVVLAASEGERLTSQDLSKAVVSRFPDSYSESVAGKIGRNAASSWTQSGHLKGRSIKVRVMANARPASLAYALFVGHLAGEAGAGLFETVYARALDRPRYMLREEAFAAAKRGWIDFREAGEIVDVGFRWIGRDQNAEVA